MLIANLNGVNFAQVHHILNQVVVDAHDIVRPPALQLDSSLKVLCDKKVALDGLGQADIPMNE